MNNILISSTKKKFIKKSFLKYDKKKLIENLKHEIFKENLEKSYYLLFDMINSGFFKDIWIIFFMSYCEYVHILNPGLLKTIHTNYLRFEQMRKQARTNNIPILSARNEFNFRKILFMILKKLIKTPKKHIGYFIPQSFNNQNKLTSHTPLLNIFDGKDLPNLNILKEVINNQDYKDVEHAMKEFHHYIDFAIHKHMTFDKQMFYAKETCFFWLAKILVIGAEHTNIIGYPYNISLYHSVDPNSKQYFSPLVWNILLNASKILGKKYLEHTITLYKLFNSNILHKSKRENFIIIQSVLLFFEQTIWNNTSFVSIISDDYEIIDKLYLKYQYTNKPKEPKIKLKSNDDINKNKDNLEKLILKREEDLKKYLPPPSDFKIEEIKKSDKNITNKKKSKKKNKKNKDDDDEDLLLPDIFYHYHNPTKKDLKIKEHIIKERTRSTIPIVKPVTISNSKRYKKGSQINPNMKVSITKIPRNNNDQ